MAFIGACIETKFAEVMENLADMFSVIGGVIGVY
jgi:hypothetical protein